MDDFARMLKEALDSATETAPEKSDPEGKSEDVAAPEDLQGLEQMFQQVQEPEDPTVSLLKHLLGAKYQLIIAYMNYGDQLRSLHRDGIYRHFQEHIAEERGQAYEIAKRLTALGQDGPASVPFVPIVSLDDVPAVLKQLQVLEQASVDLWQQLFKATGKEAAFNGLAQNGAVQDQQHVDDMERYLRGQNS
jgi:hypothetical protein